MPPKKAAAAPASANPGSDEPSMMSLDGAGDTGGGKGKKKQSDVGAAGEVQLGIEDYMMPRMMTVRLVKGVLPPQTLIHKDAATALQFSTSVFLNHIANAANEHTLQAGRKNISPQDIIQGIKDTEWGFLAPQLEEELNIYVRGVNDKRNEYRRRLKERDSGVGVAGEQAKGADNTMEDELDGGDDGPKAKRARMSEGVTLDESQMEEELPEDDIQDDGDQEGEDEVDDDEEDDDDDATTYGSAAEDLPADGADEDMDDREDEDGTDDGSESD